MDLHALFQHDSLHGVLILANVLRSVPKWENYLSTAQNILTATEAAHGAASGRVPQKWRHHVVLCATVDATSFLCMIVLKQCFADLRRRWNPEIMLDLLSLHLFLDVRYQWENFPVLPYLIRFFLTSIYIRKEAFLPLYIFVFCLFLFLHSSSVLPSVYLLWPKKKLLIPHDCNPDLIAFQVPFLFISVLVSPISQSENRSMKI